MRPSPRALTILATLATLALVGVLCGTNAQARPAPVAHPGTTGARVTHAATRAENPANPLNRYNPLANRHWGVYKGKADQIYTPYVHARGKTHRQLGRIALRPKATWFGRYIPNRQIGKKVRKYIRQTLHGDHNALVQMTIFRVDPWEDQACHSLPSKEQQSYYKTGIDKIAKAIGGTHVALILQPDGPFALCAPRHSQVYSRLIGYATRRFASLPHTAVYIEAGAADYLRGNVAKALRILLPADVADARGFAFNSTHYDSTARQIQFGAKVVDALAARGILHKHFVVNTAENGRPFTGKQYNHHRTGTNFDNAGVCHSSHQRRCVTLGIPPTTDVTANRWGLSAADEARAAVDVDAYLWIGRPWLYNQASPFVLKRALDLVRTTPY